MSYTPDRASYRATGGIGTESDMPTRTYGEESEVRSGQLEQKKEDADRRLP